MENEETMEVQVTLTLTIPKTSNKNAITLASEAVGVFIGTIDNGEVFDSLWEVYGDDATGYTFNSRKMI